MGLSLCCPFLTQQSLQDVSVTIPLTPVFARGDPEAISEPARLAQNCHLGAGSRRQRTIFIYTVDKLLLNWNKLVSLSMR